MVIKWFPSSFGDPFPKNIVLWGNDMNGSTPVYVGRAKHDGKYTPAAIVPSQKTAFALWNGGYWRKTEYELLVDDNCKWTVFSEDKIQDLKEKAISVGETVTGDAKYVGRAWFANNLVTGVVKLSQLSTFTPYERVEIVPKNFEILVYDPEHPKELDKIETTKCFLDKKLPKPTFQTNEVRALMFNPPNYVQQSTTSASTSQALSQTISATNLPATTDTWVLAVASVVPVNAVHAGYGIDESLIYVARSFHCNGYVPAKAVQNVALIPYNDQEIIKTNFEYLVGNNYAWVPYTNVGDTFPTNAVIANPLNNGDIYCIGRASYGGSLLCGKIVRPQNILYVPFDCIEVQITLPYEVLIRNVT